MVLSKMFLNKIINMLTRDFQLDKVMNYVFEENELDKKVRELEKRLKNLENMADLPKNFKCNYKSEEK
jgi:uncharacterized protein YeeX (DUF496 family)|tara:strand:- start:124 stop:327 length:204 start_codon:yes stop_codon:yes gene_type:complete